MPELDQFGRCAEPYRGDLICCDLCHRRAEIASVVAHRRRAQKSTTSHALYMRGTEAPYLTRAQGRGGLNRAPSDLEKNAISRRGAKCCLIPVCCRPPRASRNSKFAAVRIATRRLSALQARPAPHRRSPAPRPGSPRLVRTIDALCSARSVRAHTKTLASRLLITQTPSPNSIRAFPTFVPE